MRTLEEKSLPAKTRRPKDKPRTIRDVLLLLTRDPRGLWDEIKRSPPDMFAVAALLLKESGAYRFIAAKENAIWEPSHQWRKEIRQIGDEWAEWAVSNTKEPDEVRLDAEILLKAFNKPIGHLNKDPDTRNAVLRLMAAADESCWRLPLRETEANTSISRELALYIFLLQARQAQRGTFSRFDAERVQVLPKHRTPISGLTIRSLSRYLALDLSEVNSRWCLAPQHTAPAREDSELRRNLFKILLVPWPKTVYVRDFSGKKERAKTFGTFSFEPTETACTDANAESLGDRFEALVEHATDLVGDLDAVVLPEAATNWRGFRELLSRLKSPQHPNILICGTTTYNEKHGSFALLGIASPTQMAAYRQPKQHKWLLDESQIKKYHLGPRLHPGSRWWEDLEIEQRTLHFVRTRRGVTLCPLVCEDLARIEPVGELIRGVGPTLVVGLLLDGPQLTHRWSARYATVLADDPGSAVLTLTALGMSERCRDAGQAACRTVALWKDPRSGILEISLPPNADAIVLTTSIVPRAGRTVDGRLDGDATFDLLLSGIEYVREAPDRIPRGKKPTTSPESNRHHTAPAVIDMDRRVRRSGLSKIGMLCEGIARYPLHWRDFIDILRGSRSKLGTPDTPLLRVPQEMKTDRRLMEQLNQLETLLDREGDPIDHQVLLKIAEELSKTKGQESCGEALQWAVWDVADLAP